MIALDNNAGDYPSRLFTSVGSEAVKPFATVIIGGLIPATLLTLTMLPAFYSNFEKQRET
jgi:cobalt-zinc-cadmium resistance protein CzcA